MGERQIIENAYAQGCNQVQFNMFDRKYEIRLKDKPMMQFNLSQRSKYGREVRRVLFSNHQSNDISYVHVHNNNPSFAENNDYSMQDRSGMHGNVGNRRRNRKHSRMFGRKKAEENEGNDLGINLNFGNKKIRIVQNGDGINFSIQKKK